MERAGILRVAAVSAAGIACSMVAVTAWLSLVGGAWEHRTGSLVLEVLLLPSHLVWVVAGLLLALRLPRTPIAWLLLLVGLGYALVNLGINAVVYTHVVVGEQSVVSEVLAVMGDGFVFLTVAVGWLGLFLLYPDGSLPGPRWRWVLWLAVTIGVGYLVMALFTRAPVYYMPSVDNPMGWFGGPALFEAAEVAASVVLVIVGLPAAVAALLVRWRRGGAVERRQIKWLLWASVMLTGAMVVVAPTFVVPGLHELEALLDVVVALASTAVPVAILLAVSRYRLFDIDRLISRSVTYAAVAGVLLAVYTGGVLAVQTVVPASGDLAVAGATLTAAALFNPLRRRVQARVDQAFNRGRYDGQRELERFIDRLRGTIELDDIVADVLGVAARTVQPGTARLWLRQAPDQDAGPRPSRPAPAGAEARSFPSVPTVQPGAR
jgi:hypothetical protein